MLDRDRSDLTDSEVLSRLGGIDEFVSATQLNASIAANPPHRKERYRHGKRKGASTNNLVFTITTPPATPAITVSALQPRRPEGGASADRAVAFHNVSRLWNGGSCRLRM
jgi:hypothetical protein